MQLHWKNLSRGTLFLLYSGSRFTFNFLWKLSETVWPCIYIIKLIKTEPPHKNFSLHEVVQVATITWGKRSEKLKMPASEPR